MTNGNYLPKKIVQGMLQNDIYIRRDIKLCGWQLNDDVPEELFDPRHFRIEEMRKSMDFNSWQKEIAENFQTK